MNTIAIIFILVDMCLGILNIAAWLTTFRPLNLIVAIICFVSALLIYFSRRNR